MVFVCMLSLHSVAIVQATLPHHFSSRASWVTNLCREDPLGFGRGAVRTVSWSIVRDIMAFVQAFPVGNPPFQPVASELFAFFWPREFTLGGYFCSLLSPIYLVFGTFPVHAVGPESLFVFFLRVSVSFGWLTPCRRNT
jgi:hypothetical protein